MVIHCTWRGEHDKTPTPARLADRVKSSGRHRGTQSRRCKPLSISGLGSYCAAEEGARASRPSALDENTCPHAQDAPQWRRVQQKTCARRWQHDTTCWSFLMCTELEGFAGKHVHTGARSQTRGTRALADSGVGAPRSRAGESGSAHELSRTATEAQRNVGGRFLIRGCSRHRRFGTGGGKTKTRRKRAFGLG